MIEPFTFRHSTQQIVFAPGAIKHLADRLQSYCCHRAALVVDEYFADGDVIDDLRCQFDARAMSLSTHVLPNQEPDTDSVEDCLQFLARTNPDCVIALGGGSAMDTAKVARIVLANPQPIADAAGFDIAFTPPSSLFVCIPTTAGTGSEVSEMAVISKTGSDVKLRYCSQRMTANVALLDPTLTCSAPPTVTAACGFDALTHAIEGYVSSRASLMTQPYSLDAIQRLAKWLPVAYAHPNDLEARSQCLIASNLAACAFNSTALGLAHAISAPLGALHHIAHGLANALVLPAVMAFNAPSLGAKAKAVDSALMDSDAAKAVAKLRRQLGLDQGLREFGLKQSDFSAIAAAALKSGNIATNPRQPTQLDVMNILQAAINPLGDESPAERLSRSAD